MRVCVRVSYLTRQADKNGSTADCVMRQPIEEGSQARRGKRTWSGKKRKKKIGQSQAGPVCRPTTTEARGQRKSARPVADNRSLYSWARAGLPAAGRHKPWTTAETGFPGRRKTPRRGYLTSRCALFPLSAAGSPGLPRRGWSLRGHTRTARYSTVHMRIALGLPHPQRRDCPSRARTHVPWQLRGEH